MLFAKVIVGGRFKIIDESNVIHHLNFRSRTSTRSRSARTRGNLIPDRDSVGSPQQSPQDNCFYCMKDALSNWWDLYANKSTENAVRPGPGLTEMPCGNKVFHICPMGILCIRTGKYNLWSPPVSILQHTK